MLLFGVFAVTHGVLILLARFEPIHYERRWMLALKGGVSISVGLIAFIWPNITALALLYIIAVWAILAGLFVLFTAIELHAFFGDLWLLGLIWWAQPDDT